MASTPDSPQPSAKETPAEATAGDVLMDYLRLQIAEFRNQAPRVQANEPDAVHQLRMSARRLRSALTTGKGLFDDGDVSLADIRAVLKWLSGVLG
jgi:CHAD domain-containing protein